MHIGYKRLQNLNFNLYYEKLKDKLQDNKSFKIWYLHYLLETEKDTKSKGKFKD